MKGLDPRGILCFLTRLADQVIYLATVLERRQRKGLQGPRKKKGGGGVEGGGIKNEKGGYGGCVQCTPHKRTSEVL